jgi:hypothetical protein
MVRMELGLLDVRVAACGLSSRFEPSELDRAGAVKAVREWTLIINAANAALSLAAARVAECGPPPDAGALSASEWLAKATGTTAAKAKERIKTGTTLRARPKTRERAASGALSPDETAAVADAIDVNPAAEDKLLNTAATSSVGGLRDHCAKAKAQADPDPALTEKRIHFRRSLRRWRDSEGAEHLHATGTKKDMARIDQALQPLLDEIFEKARQAGVREPLDNYLFDALVALADRSTTTQGGGVRARYLAVLRIDLEALLRDSISGDETCEIAGLGPIPVSTARALLGESILKLVITKGTDVIHVTHLGRGPNTAQKIALLWQQPLCSREGCGRRARLQYDHRDEWRTVHRTELPNLDPLCGPDHHLKTHQDWALMDGTGTRPMVPPHHPDHPRNQSKQPSGSTQQRERSPTSAA